MELSERQIERVARAYRETLYGKATDETAWQNCKEHWVSDTKRFMATLAAVGLEIVEIKATTPGLSIKDSISPLYRPKRGDTPP